ncbi:hypothetical protein GZH47_32820 (plasmid) [Paenibacillus rhizovicinus]|uniref:Uncharacterized protein n=1 Tax=Paenibacillus rhizovicinus TaxID=2704463 RepID=A0A6C0PCI7_9BACL|nr:hypothetical protein [Paenibacillus rhizovicinus]QHW35683.1 hypothetical protein GZH47_32820 [Paenibacillus rhizovicinus]
MQQGVPYGAAQSAGSRSAEAPVQAAKGKWAGKVGGGLMSYGFTGFDFYSRVKDGESVLPAAAKAVATNAFWAMMPGGWGAMLGMAALQAAPAVMDAVDQAASGLGAKSQMFGGGFTENETQQWMKTQGMNSMMNARQTAAGVMANHARGARKLY